MKKFFLFTMMAFCAVGLLSWGVAGHKTVAQIAENHLTPQAKNAANLLLNGQSLSDVSTWADEVRNTPEYKNTASWHFLNLPLGLTYNEFALAVKNQSNENVYTALLKCEHDLIDKTTTAGQKAVALKFIIHFVGDLHQPMHISREEDKGGNTIQVRFDNKGTNLHSLWDSKLIERQGLSYIELAKAYDTATPAEIKQWQNDELIKWIYESYQISSQLYTEVEQNPNIDEAYYKSHLPIIQQRIEKGGIRLAGVLNEAFKTFKNEGTELPPANPTSISTIAVSINDVSKHSGETVTVCSTMAGYKSVSGMTLVNMGAAYPNQLLTVVLKGEALEAYRNFGAKSVCITGAVLDYKGKPEIIVTSLTQIKVSD